MARRYVNPNRPAPDSADNLVDFLDRAAGSQFSMAPGEVFSAYARAAMARDPGLADQLRDQLGSSGRARMPAAAQSPALAALYRPEAPGAAADGIFENIAEVFQLTVPAARARHRLDGKAAKLTAIQNSYGSEIPSAGGFLLPEELRSDMVLASLEPAIVRPRAMVVPATTARTGIPTVDDTSHATSSVFGGLTWFWAEEGAALAASTAAFGRILLDAKKLAAYLGGVPDELISDSPAFHAWLRRTVPLGLAFAEDQAFIAGTGAGEPLGLLSAPCQVQVTRAGSNAVAFTDVIKMVARMLPASLSRFVWLCSPDVLTQLLELFLNFGSATTGIVPPSDWLRWSDLQDCWTLLGRPLFPTEHVPALGTQGDLTAVDLGFVVIQDRLQMQVAATALGAGFAQDENQIRITSRLDSRVWLQSPLTPENGSQTVSPVVVLK